jgi:hypothetical protein
MTTSNMGSDRSRRNPPPKAALATIASLTFRLCADADAIKALALKVARTTGAERSQALTELAIVIRRAGHRRVQLCYWGRAGQ